jgi:hypothetical protein
MRSRQSFHPTWPTTDPHLLKGLAKPHTKPGTSRKKAKKHVKRPEAQDAEILALASLLEGWHITELPQQPGTAERLVHQRL